MKEVLIKLDTFEKIKQFVNISSQLDYDLDLISGRYVVDGKSIMGIFSLDLGNPIEVHVVGRQGYYPKEIEAFIVD